MRSSSAIQRPEDGDLQLRVPRRYLFDRYQNLHMYVIEAAGTKALLQAACAYSEYRLKIRQPLVPPKPKLFDSAWSIFIGRAWLGT